MSSLHIDRLLDTVIRQNASDLHLTVGRPPTIRLHGHLRSLETKILGPDDTTALMKSITPDRNQQEIQEEGGTDFGFAFGDKGRFRVSIFRQRGNVAIINGKFPIKGFMVNAAGDVVTKNANGDSVTHYDCASGIIYPIRTTRILATGTTATSVVVYFN